VSAEFAESGIISAIERGLAGLHSSVQAVTQSN
jgi:hypothetical protein